MPRFSLHRTASGAGEVTRGAATTVGVIERTTILGALEAMDEEPKAEPSNVAFIDGESTPWRASTFAPGVEVKDLGEANGRAMQLVRFPPGTVFPVHKHEGPEFVYILEGEMLQNGQRLGRGWASVSSAGTVDEDVRSETGCVFLLVYSE
jgi:anti-sigma factor ChrR (cupin superfamily)